MRAKDLCIPLRTEHSQMRPIKMLNRLNLEASQPSKPDANMKFDDFYQFELVVFQADDVLFRVPRHHLENQSAFFKDMFTVPVPTGYLPDGNSAEQPIMLNRVHSDDFRQLLRVLYPRNPGQADELSIEQWASVLSLALMFDFPAIEQLAQDSMDFILRSKPVDRWTMGIRFDIKHWKQLAVQQLVRRAEPFSQEDLERLGPETLLKLAALRERCPTKESKPQIQYGVADPRRLKPDRGVMDDGAWSLNMQQTILAEFGLE